MHVPPILLVGALWTTLIHLPCDRFKCTASEPTQRAQEEASRSRKSYGQSSVGWREFKKRKNPKSGRPLKGKLAAFSVLSLGGSLVISMDKMTSRPVDSSRSVSRSCQRGDSFFIFRCHGYLLLILAKETRLNVIDTD